MHTYCYSDAELTNYARQLDRWRRQGLDVYCFLLNDSAEAAMLHNAKRLLQIASQLAGEVMPKGPKLARQQSLTNFFKPVTPASKRLKMTE